MGKVGEYYSKEGEAGYWMGAGSKALGLEGSVKGEDFKALCEGYNQHGEPLMKNAGDPNRRAGWDLTLSAPKSVSVAWSVADAKTRTALEKAHAQAVKTAFEVIEDRAGYARTGAQGQTLQRAELVAAAFQHGTSREQDALLHTHVFVMNSALRGDGRAASLASEKLYEYKMAVGAAYQCALAHELKTQGHKVERDGQDTFRLSTVPRALEVEQSTRRAQIEAEMARTGATGAKAASVATLATRKAKGKIDLPVLREKWTAQAAKHGYTSAHARPDTERDRAQHQQQQQKGRNHEQRPNHPNQPRQPTNRPGNYGVPERDVRSPQALGRVESLGQVESLNSVRTLQGRSLDQVTERPEGLLPRHAPDHLEQRRAEQPAELRRTGDLTKPAAAQVLRAATEHDAIIRDKDILMHAYRAGITELSPKEAAQLALQSKAAAVAVERMDGASQRHGQAYTTQELIKAEREVLKIAGDRQGDMSHQLSAERISAAIERSAEAKGYALNTEQREALEHLAGKPGGVSVLVGDAGTGKSTTMHALKEAYEDAGYRVMGTSTGGKASAELMQSSGIDSRSLAKLQADLNTGKEQLNAKTVLVVDEAGMTDSRQMAAIMKTAEEAGAKVVLVGDHKQLQPVGAGETFRHVAAEIGSARLEDNQRQRSDWERDAVKNMSKGEAHAALSTYIEHDRVTVEKTFAKAVEDIATRQIENMSRHGEDKTVAIAGTNAAVNAINDKVRDALKEKGQLTDGQTVDTKRGQIELANGDRVLIGSRGPGHENGDTGTVKAIDAEKGQIKVKLDRTGETVQIDAKNTNLAHGYAITTHKAQGSTYEATTVYLTAQTSKEMAYVQASRARETTHFVTSSHQLKEMGANVEPTQEQRAAVDKVAAARESIGKDDGGADAARESYAAAAKYLEKNENYAPSVAKPANDNEHLAHLAKAMSQEKPKESTLDYREAQDRGTGERGQQTRSDHGTEEKWKESLKAVEKAMDKGQDFAR